MKIDSLYICVKDMNRAVEFYEELFERRVAEKDNIYSVFDIDGFRFGLFAYEMKNEPHTFGTNCLPSVSFDNIGELEKKLSGRELCFPLTRIGSNWVAEITDTEGNRIEMTAPC